MPGNKSPIRGCRGFPSSFCVPYLYCLVLLTISFSSSSVVQSSVLGWAKRIALARLISLFASFFKPKSSIACASDRWLIMAIFTRIFMSLSLIKHPLAGCPTFGVREQNRLIFLEIVVNVLFDRLVADLTQFLGLEVHVALHFQTADIQIHQLRKGEIAHLCACVRTYYQSEEKVVIILLASFGDVPCEGG